MGQWQNQRIAVVDVETTGFSPIEDRIIEVGIVLFENGAVIERYGQLIQPGKSIPEAVVKLTGITDEQVKDAPAFKEVAAEVQSRLKGAIIVGYNLEFDKGFVSAELERVGMEWPEGGPELDPLIFARQLHKGRGGNKLGQVAQRLGISLENAHRAVDDAEATGHVLFALSPNLPPTLDALLVVQDQWRMLQAQERAMRRRMRGGSVLGEAVGASTELETVDGLPALGPAYLYGDETDPLRAMYRTLPDVGSRRG